jgi:hypothetical protein
LAIAASRASRLSGLIAGFCQRRINSPQKWHLKIPQFS